MACTKWYSANHFEGADLRFEWSDGSHTRHQILCFLLAMFLTQEKHFTQQLEKSTELRAEKGQAKNDHFHFHFHTVSPLRKKQYIQTKRCAW